MEWAYWFADETVTCLILRLVIFLKPVLHTLMDKLGDDDAKLVPYQLATQSVRVINDTYNDILASAGKDLTFNAVYKMTACRSDLPSCAYIRQVKKAWADACVARIQGTAAAKTYTASSLGNHSDKTSNCHYGLCVDTVVQVSAGVKFKVRVWCI